MGKSEHEFLRLNQSSGVTMDGCIVCLLVNGALEASLNGDQVGNDSLLRVLTPQNSPINTLTYWLIDGAFDWPLS